MVTSMSHRTQITLTDEQYERLQSEVERTGSSMAELVRRAIDRTYLPDTEVERRLAGLRASAGVWADRDDIGDTVHWLRALRGDPEERFRQLWGDR